ncbi:2-keto-4-pentenoate hydratase [Actinomycetospora soli]|uniref:2-keto-4-pentenoate hydratase n=1 Tax=Actinomycetospora soli TaxID=2893887 RepID=UPI003558064F
MTTTGTTWDIASVVDTLLEAERTATARSSIAKEWPGLDVATAYDAQDLALRRRHERGERTVGVKLGLTSKAKQAQMKVDEPSVAWLTDAMELKAGRSIPVDELIHPRVEPEIVFVLDKPLRGPGVTAASALAAVGVVMAGLEIIDSRFAGYGFTLPDGIADNNSSGLFATGSVACAPNGLDLALEGCLLEIDGAVVDSATGAAVLGHPAEALAFAANQFGRRGHTLEPGWIVLTGGLTNAVPVEAGARIAAHFSHLGSVVVSG